ncbi:MAG TPA: hypothetical protein DD381_07540 [Lentisphaeria bacterium]|nr:MAG: hypothetical protein A2X47_04120 [Lentisphaerae bacterium GWF2_38_69]HBM16175.1 hypothetical protein [Lentisphaeria bacterium]
MKTKFIVYSAFFTMSVLLSSCNLLDSYQTAYTPQPAIKKDGFPIKNPIFISNVIDERTVNEKVIIDPSGSPLLLLPLWPYVYTETSPVLKYTFVQGDMLNTVKHLIASDLRASGIFSYVTTETYGAVGEKEIESSTRIPKNAYILNVEVKNAVWSKYTTAYGLSLPGSFLWIFLPESYGSVIVTLDFKLYSPENRKKAMSETTITKKISCTEWVYDQLYYMPPISEFKLAEMFPDVMTDLRDFLVNSISSKK